MFKKPNKLGFTLTEVMIGMMILTVAIVSSTSLLMGLIKTNENVVKSMQAYFLAQEGVEAVRSMRDTNWLNNLDFREGILDGDYYLARKDVVASYAEGMEVSLFNPWEVGVEDLCFRDGVGYVACEPGVEPEFKRVVNVAEACPDELVADDLCKDSFIVRSTVSFDDKEVYLEEKLTNWKGGAL